MPKMWDLTAKNTNMCPAHNQICHKCRKVKHSQEMFRTDMVHTIEQDSEAGDCGHAYNNENDSSNEYFTDTVGAFSHFQTPDGAFVNLKLDLTQ